MGIQNAEALKPEAVDSDDKPIKRSGKTWAGSTNDAKDILSGHVGWEQADEILKDFERRGLLVSADPSSDHNRGKVAASSSDAESSGTVPVTPSTSSTDTSTPAADDAKVAAAKTASNKK